MMKTTVLLLLVVAVVACCCSLSFPSATAAPAPSPAAVDCTTELLSLSDCLAYVTGNGSAAPTQSCCSELSSVVSTAPLCLCQLFNTTLVAQYGIVINYTAADALPSACNVAAPSRSQCPGGASQPPSPSSSASPPSQPPITAYAPAPQASSEDCQTALLSLSDCLEYVTGNGSAPPTPACCQELSTVVDNEPICLCQLFNTTLVGQFGITINQTASLALPSVCKVSTPDPSLCSAIGIPVGSPSAYAPAPEAASEDCQTALLSLSDCLEYVTGNGSAPPTPACCQELSSVVDNEPICLCQLFNTTLVSQFGITINQTASLALPSVCKVSTPDPSLCSALGIPVGSPSGLAASPPSSTSLTGEPPGSAAAPPGSSSSTLLLITIAAAASTLPALLF